MFPAGIPATRSTMINYCLAIDMGASGGRHILGHIENSRLVTEEVYRFENGMKSQNGQLIWDVEEIFGHILAGLRRCKALGKLPATVAIDTWGVDYVLLDENQHELLPCVAYRDSRTQAVMEEVYSILPRQTLFARTGIAEQPFNTIFQLYCDKKSGKLASASRILMLPDYFGWRLTGVAKNEYTIASTSGLVNAETRQWDEQLLKALGICPDLFLPLSQPGEGLGSFTSAVREAVGFDATVVLAPGHDTASAVLACPMGENSLYISSGTWSLFGMETTVPVTTKEAMEAGLTNEGGTHGRYRFLKNIMGMWLFQSIRKELGKRYTYDQLMHMAQDSSFTGTFDPTDAALLAPGSMLAAIRSLLGDEGLPLSDVLSAVYLSLAQSYNRTKKQMEAISGVTVKAIHIVGGGSRDRYLNGLTAKACGVPVIAGPTECTAEGNLLGQLMHTDPTLTPDALRAIITRTHEAEMHTYR